MAIERNDISDPEFELEIFQYLKDFGFAPERRGDLLCRPPCA